MAAHLDSDEAAARALLDRLVADGLVRERADAAPPRFRAAYAFTRGRQLPPRVWQALAADGAAAANRADLPATAAAPDAPSAGSAPRAASPAALPRRGASGWLDALGPRARFALVASPVVLSFGLALALLWLGAASFAAVLAFAGVITVSVFGGLLPPLLLLASRRKGECHLTGLGLLGHPVLAAAVYALFLGLLVAHGLVIWQAPLQRVGALSVAALLLAATVAMLRRGALGRRVVVELCDDRRQTPARLSLTVSQGGVPLAADRTVIAADGTARELAAGEALPALAAVRAARVQLPAAAGRDVKVWGYHLAPAGDAQPLPVLLAVQQAGAAQHFDLQLTGGQVVVPLQGACTLELTLATAPSV